jgi:MoaA/NifB/PqqE/SkfB family radical SAM enzyme
MNKSYDLKVGYSCNNRCKHCVIYESRETLIRNGKPADLTSGECFSLIEKAVNGGVKYITLTGGEITLRSDFADIIAKCAENNLDMTIQTNGRRLSADNVFEVIKNTEAIKLVVALHGSKPEIHDSITQVDGSFEQTLAGIKAVSSLNKPIILKVVISQKNEYDLPRIIDLAEHIKVKYVCLAFPHAQGMAQEYFDEVVPRYETLIPILAETADRACKHNIKIEFETIPFCVVPQHIKLVGELKYLYLKSSFTMVQADTLDWDEIRCEIKKKGTRCSQCVLDETCEGVWQEYIDTFGDAELIPIKQR